MKTYTQWTAKRSGPAMTVTARECFASGRPGPTAERLTAVRIWGEIEEPEEDPTHLVVKAELRDGSIVRLA